jgi:hypothetical protein
MIEPVQVTSKFNKMATLKTLDKLLSAKDTNSTIIELDNFVAETCAYGDELDELSEPQKLFFFNQNLEREINNGGLRQFFSNSSGDFAHETLVSLTAIGAMHTAKILQLAIDQFPERKVPKERAERQGIVEQIEDKAGEVWAQLDQQFFEYRDDLNQLNLDFVKKNKSQF